MAVPGRKISQFRGSISTGSEEDFNHVCEPCLTEGQHLEAFRHCVDCQEYLCRNCVKFHLKTKLLKNHKLVDKDDVVKQALEAGSADPCTEKCTVHRNDVIKFYCPKHDGLGCTECMASKHGTCSVEYIPDICENTGDSDEFRQTMDKLDEIMKEVDNVTKQAETKNKEVDASHDNAIKDIFKFRKEINDRLDFLQKQTVAKALEKKSASKQSIKSVLDLSSNFSSEVKQLQSSLKDSKHANQKVRMFIAMKHPYENSNWKIAGKDTQAQLKLCSDVIKDFTTSVTNTDSLYKFERSGDIELILSKQDLGKLSDGHTVLTDPTADTELKESDKLDIEKPFVTRTTSISGKERTIHTSEKGDINLTRKTDTSKCTITGYAILSSGKLVLADHNNCRIKLVDIGTKTVIKDKELDSRPWDVTELPADLIAVTVPGDGIVMTATNNLETKRSFKVSGYCYGITYYQERLYIVCQNPKVVLISNLKGNVKHLIPLRDTKLFCSPKYIVLSPNHRLVYISDCDSNTVIAVTLQGQISQVYKEKGLNGPQGMAVLEEGSLLVCSQSYNTVHHISGNLKEKLGIVNCKNLPQSVCFDPSRSELYIGKWRCDFMEIFSLEYDTK